MADMDMTGILRAQQNTETEAPVALTPLGSCCISLDICLLNERHKPCCHISCCTLLKIIAEGIFLAPPWYLPCVFYEVREFSNLMLLSDDPSLGNSKYIQGKVPLCCNVACTNQVTLQSVLVDLWIFKILGQICTKGLRNFPGQYIIKLPG